MPSLTKVQSGFVEAQGALPLSPGTAAAPGLKFDDHAGTGMFSPSTGEIAFSTSGHSQAVTFKTDGKVGIGTASPSSPLHVSATNNSGWLAQLINAGTGTDANGLLVQAGNSSTEYSFKVSRDDGTDLVSVRGNGLVGIGAANNTSYDTNAQNLLLASSGNTGMTIRSAGSTPFAMIHFADGTTDNSQKRAGRIVYQHDGDNLMFNTANEERLRIKGTGQVLINTTDAGSNGTADDLVVANNGSASDQAGITIRGGTSGRSQIFFSDGTSGQDEYRGMLRYDHSDNSMQFRTNAVERFHITSTGKIGVGGAPAAWHSAASSKVIQVGNSVLFDYSAAQFDVGHNYYYDGSNYKFTSTGYAERITFSKSDGSIRFWSLGTGSADATATVSEKLRITSDGKVGVNQTIWTSKNHMFEVKQSTNDKEIARFTVDGASGSVQGRGYIGLSVFVDTVYPHAWIGVEEDTNASYRGDLIFGTRGSASDSAPTEKFRITAAGNLDIGNNSGSSSNSGWWIQQNGTAYVFSNAANDAIKIYAGSADERITLRGNGSASFASNALNINTAGNILIANPTTSAKLNILGDISGNYTGWKEKGVASGSMSAASIASKTPTINDFTYPNNSNGMLIWSTSKIGFAAGAESPQYGSGVQMLFDSGGLILGGNRAFDRTTVSSTATNWTVKLRTSGIGQFKSTLYANPFQLSSADSWIKSGYGAISNSTVSSLNNLMIAQNIRGYLTGIDGGSVNNNFYSVVSHGGMGYAGIEYCYGGITKFYNGTASSMGGATSANTAFTPSNSLYINGNGIVTKPKNPSFQVSRNQSNWSVVGGGTKFDWNLVEHNTGSHFSVSNDRFTAPVSGTYQFNFSIIWYHATLSNEWVSLRKNGSRITGGDVHFSADFSTSRWHHVSYSLSAFLNSSDYVEMFNGGNTISYHGTTWGQWSGYLVG